MSAGGCELITVPISHYGEKARWALDRARVPYRERPHLQGIHSIVRELAAHPAGAHALAMFREERRRRLP